jgi:hypothetical protein
MLWVWSRVRVWVRYDHPPCTHTHDQAFAHTFHTDQHGSMPSPAPPCPTTPPPRHPMQRVVIEAERSNPRDGNALLAKHAADGRALGHLPSLVARHLAPLIHKEQVGVGHR